MDSFDLIMDGLVVGCGVYLIYHALKIKKTREIRNSPLIGKTLEIRRTSDVEGYINYLCPKALFFGALIVIGGLVQLVMSYLGMPNLVRSAIYFTFFGVTVIFCIIINKGQKKYLIEPTRKKKKPETDKTESSRTD